jgi:hypothetical protein
MNEIIYRMTPLDNPAANTLMDIPSGAVEKHSDVIMGLVVVMPIKVPLTDLSSRRDCSPSARCTTHAISAVLRLIAN